MTDQTFEDLYKSYTPKLNVMFSKSIKDKQTVEDLIQDTMLKVYSNLSSYDSSKAAVSTWIYTIARNVLSSYFITNSRKPQLTSDDSLDSSYSESFDSPENLLIAEQTKEAINKAASKLNPAFLDVFTLKDFDGLSLKQIATKLDVPINTVKTRHKRAKDSIKESLA